MVTIGEGRNDDPRQWVQAAYLVLDAIKVGDLGELGKLPTQAEVAEEMGVNRATVSHAYRELADIGIVYLVPGLGYFATARGSQRAQTSRQARPTRRRQRMKTSSSSS
jgi:DNA-binding GntR family transcriptional regulator